MTIAESVERVQAKIAEACARSGRSPSDVSLIAVSKTHPAERVLEAVAAGLQHFGENRVEESVGKIPIVTAAADHALTWHMIGHVQSRKAKDLFPWFQVIHSVDSIKLAEKLSRLALDAEGRARVLLEVNISGEVSKSGFAAYGWERDSARRSALLDEIRPILTLPGLEVRGLMTIAPIVATPEDARPIFAGLVALRDVLQNESGTVLPELSMGMTDDYPIAVEEGATWVRVGRAIFGERT